MYRYTLMLLTALIMFGCEQTSQPISGNDTDELIYKGAKVLVSISDLPDCGSAEEGQLFYVLDKKAFKYCDGSGYQVLDLKGPQGDSGASGQDGTDGRSIIWKGELSFAPSSPESNWAYYNTSDRAAYIYDGSEWDTLSVSGKDGAKGDSFYWLGILSSAPTSPALNEAYYNTTDNMAYIWDGNSWEILVRNGAPGSDGISIIWKGSMSSAPSSPDTNWAYYNSTDKVSYIYTGADWDTLSVSGSDGTKGDPGAAGQDGIDGTDGISIIWKGSMASAPSSPDTNWAYYNSTDKVSYIYTGAGWDTLSVSGSDGTKGDTGAAGQDGIDGTDGVSIIWKGSMASAPSSPDTNWAYYNSTDKVSYIYTGAGWDTLSVSGSDGANGSDGISINWLGDYSTAPASPSLNDAYRNTIDGNAYIWNGVLWKLLVEGTEPSMVYITGGTFTMGSANIGGEATPEHFVTLNDFRIDKTEVTQGDYSSLMRVTYSAYSDPNWNEASGGAGSNYPAYKVNWYDAVLYCNARSKRDGLDTVYSYTSITGISGNDCVLNGLGIDLAKNGYRLPTEAEWEYACRAGTTTDFYWGKNYNPNPSSITDSSEIDRNAVWWRNSWRKGSGNFGFGVHEAGSLLPNGFGLYDMIGNVWEWCNDWYGSYGSASVSNPTGPDRGSLRVLRGGDWRISHILYLSSAVRSLSYPENEFYYFGFRVALPVQ